ncbi:MAG: HypC/HybG/HupF family hydrogenase formation chaperone [Crenarchaeota archaeon]|nr:HypC/HybG/HupF family hydrogenase formation chaperone [Thermoproteota archaeon]MDW8033652.1 HypC/HybG/HupF family hydrogenase formation chaperone [Nitrososphaerota archaeon]
MCLGIPGRVEEVKGDEAIVSFGGTRRYVRLDLLDNVSIGDYVIVHAGFAIQVLDQKTALEMLEMLREVSGE